MCRELYLYCWLRQKRVSGVWKNIKSEKALIAKELGVSENSIRKYLKTLKRIGFIYYKNGYLYINCMHRHLKHLEIAKFRKHYRRNSVISLTCTIKSVKEHFLAVSLKNQRITQLFKVKSDTLDRCGKPTLKLVKEGNLNDQGVLQVIAERGLRTFSMDSVGISRGGISKLMNRQSEMTGSRWVKRLISADLIASDERRRVFICNGDNNALQAIRDNNPKGVYYLRGNEIFKRSMNEIKFHEPELNRLLFSDSNIKLSTIIGKVSGIKVKGKKDNIPNPYTSI